MTPEDASTLLRQGKVLDVDMDTAELAIALTIPHVFRYIDPTQTDGNAALARFRKLCDNAGLSHNHPAIGAWMTLRALRPTAGDAILVETNCHIAHALAAALGTVNSDADGFTIRDDRAVPAAISITSDAPTPGETGVIVTPAGVIRFPGATFTSTAGGWSTALSALDSIPSEFNRRAYSGDPDAVVQLAYTRPDRSGSVEADSIHEDWTPEIAFHDDLKAHPAKLIQSATLATVTFPKTSYRPKLPRRVIQTGFISDAQFEFIVAAGEAHSKHLPLDPATNKTPRTGIYLADGTGAGKSNEILGVIMDNMFHGRKKAVLVLAKRRHLKGFIDAWRTMGRSPRDIINQWDLKPGDPINARAGILVTTYSTIRDYCPKGEVYPRIAQIKQWVGDDFDGVLAFDEAQEMRNGGADEATNRNVQISQQGLAGIEIQEQLWDARVVYASATGATDVYNLAYATRLGMWGAHTCFPNRNEFTKSFEQGGIADLEQVTLSLKAAGLYIARSLSFDGVDTQHLAVTLTPQERAIYNETATAWGRLWDTYQHTMKLCGLPADKEVVSDLRKEGLKGVIPHSHLNGVYEANRKASMATLIAAFKARAVIADAKDQIANGRSVVIQMQNTYEAQLNRALDRAERPDEIRLEPSELLAFAEGLPVEMHEKIEEEAEDGKIISFIRPKLDAAGNPVVNHTAVTIKNNIMAELRNLKLPLPALDQIMLAFGPARLAEVTGRSKRLVPNRPHGDQDGATGVMLEERSEAARMADIESFHNGDKLALVFSTGAGGASLSYHAKRGSGNERRRVHYVIQLGYRADEVAQGIGRTHRSDQVEPPILQIVSCDLPADRLYASRIVSALFKLGALTQGHRHAASNGMFDERDCLDGPYAVKAWADLQEDLQNGLIPDYNWQMFMADLGLSSAGAEKTYKWDKTVSTPILTNINRLINRVAALTDRRQQLIFDYLREKIDGRIEKAIADGTFNAGPETLKATSLKVVSEEQVNADLVHQAPTRLLRIEKKSEISLNSFADAYRIYARSKNSFAGPATFCKHRTTGQIALIAPGKPIFNILGHRFATRDILTPTSSANREARIVDREPWHPIGDMDLLETMWNAAVEAAPKESTSYITLVTGALLPVWNAIDQGAGFRRAVYRLQTDDGQQIVGRPLTANGYLTFCEALDISAEPNNAEIDALIAHLEKGDRVAIGVDGKNAHFLSGTFTRGTLAGVELELTRTPSPMLNIAINALSNATTTRAAGTTISLANTRADIAHALRVVLSGAPALWIEEAAAPIAAVAPAPPATLNAQVARALVA